MPRIDATAAVPIDLASKLTLGASEAARRLDRQLRVALQRLRLWFDRQHLPPEQVVQLIVLGVYGLVAVAEAWAYRSKRQET